MLQAWVLANFKSVTEETNLEFGKLTIFTGANSAGKSTVIQSILLTAQSLQSAVTNRPVIMNGNMARLGSFRDVVSSADKSRHIKIGFNLSPYMSGNDVINASRFIGQRLHFIGGRGPNKIKVMYSFSASPGPNDPSDSVLDLQPRLESAKVSISYFSEDNVEKNDQISVDRADNSISARRQQYLLDAEDIQSDQLETLRYSAKVSQTGHKMRLEGLGIAATPVGAVMHHFLPRAITVRYDNIDAEVAAKIAILTQPTSYGRRYNYSPLRTNINDEAADLIANIFEKATKDAMADGPSDYWYKNYAAGLSQFKAEKSMHSVREIYNRLPGRITNLISSAMDEKRIELSRLLRNSRPPEYSLDVQYPAEHMSVGLEQVQIFFSSYLKYLGPLRDEPKPLYPLAGSSDTTDVGFRGEHTAAVLDAHKETQVRYIPSASFSDTNIESSTESTKSLSAAVDDWLNYMGVGKNSITSDSGKLGHTLKVKTHGTELEHDLTQVGVGVSQVLPILVLALIAEPGSTLIFEQPELHLHPRVQTRLADFFVSMTRIGKQCIVETHSEYLINRLRYRSASDKGSDVSESVVIYFVEKEGVRSVYRLVKIDDLGNLDNWPEGFFDESERSTTALLKKSLEKRRRKAKEL